jgi:hypothetical protein
MANIAVRNPLIYKRAGNLQEQKGPVADGGANADSTSIAAGHFVVASGAFPDQVIKSVRDGANGTLIFGWCPDAVRTSTQKPPTNLPTGDTKHYVFNPAGQSLFLMNITDSSGNVGSSGPAGTTVSIGGQYGLKTVTVSGILCQCVNKDDTTYKLFEVVEYGPNQASTDKNPLVVVKVIGTVIQA